MEFDEITQTVGKMGQHNVVIHMQFTRNTSGRKYFSPGLHNARRNSKNPFVTSHSCSSGKRNKNSEGVIYCSNISVKNVDFCVGIGKDKEGSAMQRR